ncbi:MAG: ATP-binding protein [Desulfobacterales bacterium]|nr:ATP-binding protein [Desulfobacterales bacterium]
MIKSIERSAHSANQRTRDVDNERQAILELVQKIENLIYFPEKIEKPARIPNIWEVFSKEIKRYIETDVCALFRVDDQSHAFELAHCSPDDLDEHCRREIDAQIECGMFAWIINRRQPALIPSLVFKKRKTLIMLPLTTQTQTLGLVMVVTGISEGAITHERLKLLAILAKQCALIMENTLLFAQLQKEHETLQNAQSRIIQAEKFAAFGRMTSGAFHEFLNPLNILSGHLQLMQMSELPPAKIREYAALMQTQTDRIASMVKSLQRFSSPRKSECQILQLHPLIMAALDNTRARFPDHRIRCDVVVAADCPPANVNREEFIRVLMHLFDNAYEAMPLDGTLRIRLEQDVIEDIRNAHKEMIACRINDSGRGIPAENLAKIFDPFYTTKEVGAGTGLNLSISYALIQSMGGTITAQSAEGCGATFTVYLPGAEASGENCCD